MRGVVFCGASGVGKSTLAYATAGRYGFKPLPSLTAEVYGDFGITYTEAMKDAGKLEKIQREIYRRTAARLREYADAEPPAPARGFVSERGLDVQAYTALMLRGATLSDTGELPDGIAEVLRRSHVVTVFVRPCPEILAESRSDDKGRRNIFLSDEWVYRADGAIRLLLELSGVDYLNLDMPGLVDRMKLIGERCAAAGIVPAV